MIDADIDRTARALKNLRPDFTRTNAVTFAKLLRTAPPGVFGHSPLHYVPAHSPTPARSANTRPSDTSRPSADNRSSRSEKTAAPDLIPTITDVGSREAEAAALTAQLNQMADDGLWADISSIARTTYARLRAEQAIATRATPGDTRLWNTTIERANGADVHELASLLAKALYATGHVARGETYEMSERQFFGGAAAASTAIEQARGGVLVIGGVPAALDDAARASMEVLLRAVEAKRAETTVVVVGTAAELATLVQLAPGLRPRIRMKLKVPAPSVGQTVAAVKHFANESAARMDDAALSTLEEAISAIRAQYGDEGEAAGLLAGAGWAREIADAATDARAMRLVRNHDEEMGELSDDELLRLTAEDMRMAVVNVMAAACEADRNTFEAILEVHGVS